MEALELYERMFDLGGPILPNAITVNSLLEALDKAGQKELAQSKYREAFKEKLINPWKQTKDSEGKTIKAMVSLLPSTKTQGHSVVVSNRVIHYDRISIGFLRPWRKRRQGI